MVKARVGNFPFEKRYIEMRGRKSLDCAREFRLCYLFQAFVAVIVLLAETLDVAWSVLAALGSLSAIGIG